MGGGLTVVAGEVAERLVKILGRLRMKLNFFRTINCVRGERVREI